MRDKNTDGGRQPADSGRRTAAASSGRQPAAVASGRRARRESFGRQCLLVLLVVEVLAVFDSVECRLFGLPAEGFGRFARFEVFVGVEELGDFGGRLFGNVVEVLDMIVAWVLGRDGDD